MYIYSEKTKKKYATVDECINAEKAYDEQIAKEKEEKEKLANARAERAKEVEAAYEKVTEARNAYEELLEKFCEDYGSFHFTVHNGERNPFSIFDLFF